MRFSKLFSRKSENEPVLEPAPEPAPEPVPRKLPNKLSKPRTNNNSNLNLLNTKSAPASRRNSVSINNEHALRNSRNSNLPSEAGDVPGKRKDEPTQKRRMSLFRSRSEKAKERDPELDPELAPEFVESSSVNSSSHRWSRQPVPRARGFSFVTEPPAASVEQHQYDISEELHTLRTRMSFHQAQAAQYEQQLNRLSLVAELPSPYLHQQVSQLEIKGISRRNSIYEPSDNGTSVAGSVRGSDVEKYGPIRRRSLLQHGIATRPMEIDSRRSLPSQVQAPVELPSHSYAPTNDEYFPPTGLRAFGPNSAFAEPGPRTETPTDLDYRHIGAFKLGSLRITNGAASPTSTRDGRTHSLGGGDEYTAPGQTRRSLEKEQRHGLSHRSNTLSVPAEARKITPWVVRSESPLRQTASTEFLSIDIPDPSFALFDFQSTELLFKSTHSPTKSLELAHDYQQEIASSPFSFDNSPFPSPRLESTSKHTAIEDDLFAPEPNTPNLEGIPRLPHSFDSAYEGGPILKPKGQREKDPKPLAKADSGYGSIVSSRSFKKDGPAVPPKDPPTPIRETFVRVPSSTYSVNSSIGPENSLRSKRSLPAIPTDKVVEKHLESTQKVPALPMKASPYEINSPLPSSSLLRQSIEQAVIQAKPHLQVPKSEVKRKSMPVVVKHVREARDGSPDESEKSVSSASSSIWQRKRLTKRVSRPSSFQPQPEPVFTVQAFRSPSEVLRIPVPSFEIRRQLDERVESFPVTSFANTSSGTTQLRRTASKETLGTIFSVGSAEVRDELNFARLQGALPAIPTEPTIQEDSVTSWAPRPDFNKRHTFQASSPMPPPAEDWKPSKPVHLPASREQSRDRNSLPSFRNELTPLPKGQAQVSTQEPAPRKSFQQTTMRDPSPEPLQTRRSRDVFQKPLSRAPSPGPTQDWNPRKSFQEMETNKPVPPPAQAQPIRYSFQALPARDPSPGPAQGWTPRKSFSKPASRDPSPAPTSRANLQSEFEAHITSYDAISSSLGRSPYDVALGTLPRNNASSGNDKAKSMTAQFEADAAQRFAMHRTASQESYASTVIRPRRSYESIKNSNPWSGDNRSAPRLSSKGPPSAHANGRRPYSFQQALSRESLPSYGAYGAHPIQEQSRLAYQKPKAAPPITMQTQKGAVTVAKRSLPSPPPNRTAPQPPAPSLPPKDNIADVWKNTAGAWAERKKSAGEALSARTSIEMARPQASKPDFQQVAPQHELRARRSMDARSYGESFSRDGGGRQSMEYNQPHTLHGGKSFDTSQQRQSSWGSNSGYHNSNQQVYNQPEYNHTYGSADHSQDNKENIQQYTPEPEYYDTEPVYQQPQYLPETIHQRKTSTSEMLVLDRFSGGLGYGYEPGMGLVGSAGVRTTGKMGNATRKSMKESMEYGVDFSDVPIILQRMRV